MKNGYQESNLSGENIYLNKPDRSEKPSRFLSGGLQGIAQLKQPKGAGICFSNE